MKEIYHIVTISNNFDYVIEAYQVFGDGKIIALIDYNGGVTYNNDDAKVCPNVQKKIANFIEKNKLYEKKNLSYYD